MAGATATTGASAIGRGGATRAAGGAAGGAAGADSVTFLDSAGPIATTWFPAASRRGLSSNQRKVTPPTTSTSAATAIAAAGRAQEDRRIGAGVATARRAASTNLLSAPGEIGLGEAAGSRPGVHEHRQLGRALGAAGHVRLHLPPVVRLELSVGQVEQPLPRFLVGHATSCSARRSASSA